MFVRSLALLVPFALIAWVQWVRSLQLQRQQGPPVTSVQQRDTYRVLASLRSRRARQMQENIEQEPPQRQVPAAAVAAAAPERKKVVEPTASASTAASAASASAAAGFGGPPKEVEPLGSSKCPASRKPYHTLLTATAQVYQQWQCRVMYYNWKKRRALDPAGACTEMTSLTRLVAHGSADKDGLENEIPSYFVKEYTGRDMQKFRGYRVINRPYSVTQLLQSAYWKSQIREDYIFIAETDHILTQALPNKASLGSPMAYIFNYMGPNPAHKSIIKTVWPEGGEYGFKRVQSIGPSPVLLHRQDLEAIAAEWESTAVALKTNNEADSKLGWVIEMWGYAIAAAKVGLKHQEFADFQVEPGALSSAHQLKGFPLRYWIFHYTYQFEYMLDGTACQPWTIGEFSLDKRHFSDQYPTPPMPQPPKGANDAAFYLLNAFNEAMGNISAWPKRQPSPSSGVRPTQTLYGRRRLDWFSRHANGFQTELRTMPLVKHVSGTEWKCGPASGNSDGGTSFTLSLKSSGDVTGLPGSGGVFRSGSGRWGSMNDPTLGAACPVYSCLYMDMGGMAHEGRVSSDEKTLTIMLHQTLKELHTCSKASGGSWL